MNKARATGDGNIIWFCFFRDLIIYTVLLVLTIVYIAFMTSGPEKYLVQMAHKMLDLDRPVLISQISRYLQQIFNPKTGKCFANRESYVKYYKRFPVREETFAFQHNNNLVSYRLKLVFKKTGNKFNFNVVVISSKGLEIDIGNPYTVLKKVVSKKTCRLHHMVAIFEDWKYCFNTYTEGKEETSSLSAFNVEIPYSTGNAIKDTFHVGEITSYCGGGHSLEMIEEALVNVIRINRAIFRNGTSAVMLDLLMYNQNFNSFVHLKFVFEAPIVGGIRTNYLISVISLPISVFDIFSTVLDVLITLYFLYELVQDLQFFRWKALSMIWVYFDAVYITLSLYTFVHTIHLFLNKYKYIDDAHMWLLVVEQENRFSYCVALCCIFVAFRALKIINFRIISLTLKKSVTGLVGFLFLFIVVNFAFAVIGKLLFGKCDERFEHYVKGMAALVLLLMGDFNADQLYDCTNATFWFLTGYFLIAITITLNIGLGIINQAYHVAKTEIQISPAQISIWQYLRDKFCGKMRKDYYYENVMTERLEKLGYKSRDIKDFLKRLKKESEIVTETSEDVTVQDIYKQQALYDEVHGNVEWTLEFMKDLIRYLDENEYIVQIK